MERKVDGDAVAGADEDHYVFDPRHLSDPDDNLRRWAIIHVSSLKLTEYEEKLGECLPTANSMSNRRHIVRALGNMGGPRSIPVIRSVLESSSGLLLGEAAEALGKLGDKNALPTIENLINSPIEFVGAKALWSVRRLKGEDLHKLDI